MFLKKCCVVHIRAVNIKKGYRINATWNYDLRTVNLYTYGTVIILIYWKWKIFMKKN